MLPNLVTLQKPIYFDYAATTPVHPSVFEQMRPYFMEDFGNAGSSQHYYGWVAEEAIQHARSRIAKYFSVAPNGIVFTSGATESNNLAILGYLKDKKPGHIITSSIEHKAVLAVCKHLEKSGWSVTYVKPTKEGMIEVADIAAAIQPNTVIMSFMLVNNELGTVADYKAIRALADQHQLVFHSDATQAIGKLALDTSQLPHLMSFSGHKIYGPKGVGALVVQAGITLQPLVYGGGQERGLRSGTLAVPQIVGLAASFELMPALIEQALVISEFKSKITSAVPKTWINNGQHGNTVPHILSLSLPHTDWESLFQRIPALAVSNGSACNARTHLPSHVLQAIGLSDSLALATLRISFGIDTTSTDVDFLIDYLNEKLVNP